VQLFEWFWKHRSLNISAKQNMESYELTQEFRTKYVASAPADCLQTLTTAAASKNEQSQHSKYSTEHGMIIYL